jgi:hypothetical protein
MKREKNEARNAQEYQDSQLQLLTCAVTAKVGEAEGISDGGRESETALEGKYVIELLEGLADGIWED